VRGYVVDVYFCVFDVSVEEFGVGFGFRFDLIFWCFNATFSNISAISWRPVLVMEEAGENHRPWASNW
jgi:hypothetical protein